MSSVCERSFVAMLCQDDNLDRSTKYVDHSTVILTAGKDLLPATT